MTKAETLLRELVAALQATYWSAWQSTNKFAPVLKKAEAYIEEQDDRQHDA